MKIGILGSRGIPNQYGGFEECAEQLAARLVKKGHAVTVYSSHTHPIKVNSWKGVRIARIWDPEKQLGTAGQFIYDFFGILDSHKRNYDIILQLGYTSSGIWQAFLPRKSRIVTNMDGLEWKRAKYSKTVQQFLKWSEGWSARKADQLIADSLGIQDYLAERYGAGAVYIPYGAEVPENPDMKLLEKYSVESGNYQLILARMEPENNIEMILDGIVRSHYPHPTLVVGNRTNAFSKKMEEKFKDSRIRFLNGIYSKDETDALRFYARRYFHGHSVGGTNPSLLEAMACGCLIYAHDNVFNRSVLNDNARFFSTAEEVRTQIEDPIPSQEAALWKKANLNLIRDKYNWDVVADQYQLVFQHLMQRK